MIRTSLRPYSEYSNIFETQIIYLERQNHSSSNDFCCFTRQHWMQPVAHSDLREHSKGIKSSLNHWYNHTDLLVHRLQSLLILMFAGSGIPQSWFTYVLAQESQNPNCGQRWRFCMQQNQTLYPWQTQVWPVAQPQKNDDESSHIIQSMDMTTYITIYGWMDGWMDGWIDG